MYEIISGDGLSKETAFVLTASDHMEGIKAEYEILDLIFLDTADEWIRKDHELIKEDGLVYDRFELEDIEGDTYEIGFNITDYFGKYPDGGDGLNYLSEQMKN